jgi:hypothetical protein
MTRNSDAVRRALRTLFQFIAAGGLTELVDEVAADLTGTAKAAVFMVAALVITYAQNELEDRGAIPAVLKAPPSPGADPVPGAGA